MKKMELAYEIETMLNVYLKSYKDEQDSVSLFKLFLRGDPSLTKAQRAGHFTGSAWIVNQNRELALMTHHAKLDKWFQLGGHAEEGESPLDASYREAKEESGLKSVQFLHKNIYDIDAHLIPEHKGQAEHFHFDIRFLFTADSNESLSISKESKDLKWVPIEDVSMLNNSDSICRMVEKMKYFEAFYPKT
ncbi:NUDIX domain-containing protein [Oceanispirochaeta crateris]|uniref:NUDIX domain-containing protein n=1 Tax=Oceanispirochaeta crateris TaxID=2518645 RepID=A0A5C1QNY0_9SPIO|nr:NUDIX hydrolase [Oceanispirochaeta crateris]QEN08690.1 NUDIX domain-containing protein [Oceanispirochaeta crateris]